MTRDILGSLPCDVNLNGGEEAESGHRLPGELKQAGPGAAAVPLAGGCVRGSLSLPFTPLVFRVRGIGGAAVSADGVKRSRPSGRHRHRPGSPWPWGHSATRGKSPSPRAGPPCGASLSRGSKYGTQSWMEIISSKRGCFLSRLCAGADSSVPEGPV